MKNVLLFAAIMLVCGSLKKDDRVKCPEKVKVSFYFKGKILGSEYVTYQNYSSGRMPVKLASGKDIVSDSTVYSLSY